MINGRVIGILFVVGLIFFVLIQLLPVDRTNPQVVNEPNWDAAPGTLELAKAACFDCHSNETVWPWYAKVAPVSWMVTHDVSEGRSQFNFSEWDPSRVEAEEFREVIEENEMPPSYYAMMHGDARLSDDEKQRLINGLYIIMGVPTAPTPASN